MPDLRRLLENYEKALELADRTDQELARAIRERIRYGGRGEASAVARELGWTRGRLNAWMKRAGRKIHTDANRTEAGRPASDDASSLADRTGREGA